ncbi:hypothetical protein NDU88_000033, partial [Pleurodeles waltl]
HPIRSPCEAIKEEYLFFCDMVPCDSLLVPMSNCFVKTDLFLILRLLFSHCKERGGSMAAGTD